MPSDNYIAVGKGYGYTFFFLRMLFSNSLSHLQPSGGKPCPRVIVQGNGALFTVGWLVLWAELDDMVHGLFWVAAIACNRVLKSPAFHGSSKTDDTGSEAVKHCPLSTWAVFSQQFSWLIHKSVPPRVACCLLLFRPTACEPHSLGCISRCGPQELVGMLRERPL